MIKILEISDYKWRFERGIVIRIEAIEWNCPQHITPRYSEAEVGHVLEPLLEKNKQLRDQLLTLQESRHSDESKD